MGFFENLFRYAPALEFALTKWFGDRATWKYIVILIVLSALTTIGAVAALVVPMIGLLAGGAQQNILQIIGVLPQAIGAMLVVLVVGSLAIGYVHALVMARALQVAGYSPPAFGLYKYLRLIVLNIAASVSALLSLQRAKWLALGIAGIALAAAGLIIMPALLPVGAILLAAYAIVVIYNSFRLVFSSTILINSSSGVLECIRTSNQITKGRVWSIVAVLFVFGVLSALVQTMAGILQPSAEQTLQIISTSGLAAAALSWIVASLISICVTMVFVVMANFLNVGLFQLVSGEHKGLPRASGKPPSEPATEAAQRA